MIDIQICVFVGWLDGLVLLLGDSSLLLPQLMCGPVILRKGGKEKKRNRG